MSFQDWGDRTDEHLHPLLPTSQPELKQRETWDFSRSLRVNAADAAQHACSTQTHLRRNNHASRLKLARTFSCVRGPKFH